MTTGQAGTFIVRSSNSNLLIEDNQKNEEQMGVVGAVNVGPEEVMAEGGLHAKDFMYLDPENEIVEESIIEPNSALDGPNCNAETTFEVQRGLTQFAGNEENISNGLIDLNHQPKNNLEKEKGGGPENSASSKDSALELSSQANSDLERGKNSKKWKKENTEGVDSRYMRGDSRRATGARQKQQKKLAEKENWNVFVSDLASDEEREGLVMKKDMQLSKNLQCDGNKSFEEAKTIWNLGKKLGLSAPVAEEVMIEKIRAMEEEEAASRN